MSGEGRRTAIETDRAPAPAGGYSQGIVAAGTLYCAGQVGLDPATGTVAVGIAAQTGQALQNLEAVVAAAGGSLADIVSVTVFLRRMADAPEFDRIYRDLMPPPWPTRATVGVELPDPFLIEVSATAVISRAPDDLGP